MSYPGRSLLFALPPERAHQWALRGLQCRLRLGGLKPPPVVGARTCMGLSFPNPIGLAAGFDKNGSHIDALATLGFGFIEVGGVTPHPQPGTPRPRIFRLPQAKAIINRMGFNNDGAEAMAGRLRRRQYSGVLGVNIGKNADTAVEDTVKDYLRCLDTLYPYGDFFTINISSPNTAGLRAWQTDARLEELLGDIIRRRDSLQATHNKRAPLLVKISPDLEADALENIAAVMTRVGIDGAIACNTTLARPDFIQNLPHGKETGGLSGAPLAAASTQVIKSLRQMTPKDFVIIGVGGILSADAALEKLNAGADLLQIYSGLIYEGPGLIRRLHAAIK